MSRFDPSSITCFRFVGYQFDPARAQVHLRYAFDDHLEFTERLTFHQVPQPLTEAQNRALANCWPYVHLMLGVSYYKAAVPPVIRIDNYAVSETTAHFFDTVYLHGLAEFAYRNRLDLRPRIRFPYRRRVIEKPSHLPLPRRTAVPVGGGKDSAVTIEAFKAAGLPLTLIALGRFEPIQAVAAVAGLPLTTMTRRIDPRLIELNRHGAYNGHVPISAIIALLLPVCAILYGFDSAALSNERSANFGNLVQNGLEVNHQYSKSLDFERAAADLMRRRMLAEFTYFSFLRPLSDLHIARLFSRLKPYHGVFRSCNQSFRLDETRRGHGWCGHCPKCLFTFLTLAPFMPRAQLVSIFGANLLDDPAHEPLYHRLLGIAGAKPFECVGEADESIAAMILLTRQPDWQDTFLVRRFAERLLPALTEPDARIRSAFSLANDHCLPSRYAKVLRALTES